MWLRLRSAYEDKIGKIRVAGRMKAVRHLNLRIRKDEMKEPIFASPQSLTTETPFGSAGNPATLPGGEKTRFLRQAQAMPS